MSTTREIPPSCDHPDYVLRRNPLPSGGSESCLVCTQCGEIILRFPRTMMIPPGFLKAIRPRRLENNPKPLGNQQAKEEL